MPGEISSPPASNPAATPGGRGGLVLGLATVVLSLGLMVLLAFMYVLYNSQLALAQAADSFSDVFTAGVLAWSMFISRQPRDKNHHFGHGRAEPIGALVAAVMAGVLAFAVIRSAADSLLTHNIAHLDWPAALAFGAKTLIKSAVAIIAFRMLKRGASPAVGALMVDARNDAIMNSIAIAGGAAAYLGWPAVDSWLALPTGLWIGYSGFKLARDNIKLLMGEAPSEARQEELLKLAAQTPGVIRAHDLMAHYIGTTVEVLLTVVVDPTLSLKQGHDIGEAVKERLEAEPDVSNASVHVDIE